MSDYTADKVLARTPGVPGAQARWHAVGASPAGGRDADLHGAAAFAPESESTRGVDRQWSGNDLHKPSPLLTSNAAEQMTILTSGTDFERFDLARNRTLHAPVLYRLARSSKSDVTCLGLLDHQPKLDSDAVNHFARSANPTVRRVAKRHANYRPESFTAKAELGFIRFQKRFGIS